MSTTIESLSVNGPELLSALIPRVLDSGVPARRTGSIINYVLGREIRIYLPASRDRHTLEVLIPKDLGGGAWDDLEADYKKFELPATLSGVNIYVTQI